MRLGRENMKKEIALKLTKKLALTALLTTGTLTHAADLMDKSESYSSKYLRHMSEHISDVNHSKSLESEVSGLSSQLSRLQNQKQALENELQSAKTKKSQLQAQKQSIQSDISNTQMRIQFLLEEFYPRYSSVNDLKQGIQSERIRLESRVGVIQDEIAQRSSPFLKRIDIIEADTNQKQQLLSQTISDKKSNQSRLNSSVNELKKLEQKIAALKKQMANKVKLNADVAAAEAKYKKAKDRKGDRKCILGGLFSSKCRDYFKAKDELSEIKDIQSGKTLANKEKDLAQEKTKIIGYKQKIEKAAQRERQLNASIRANQNEVFDQQERIARVTASLRPALIQSRSDLREFEASLGNANRIFSYEDEVASLKSKHSYVNGQIQNLNSRIPALPSEIAAKGAQVSEKTHEFHKAQAELSSSKEEIQNDKSELLMAQSELKVALLQTDEVDVNIDLPFFSENQVYSERDWSFSMAEGSVFQQGSTTCVAKTKATSKKGDLGSLSVGKVLTSHEDSEPTVFIKVETKKADELTTKAKSITVTAPNSSREFKLNLVPGLSTSDELIFVVEIDQREDLIAVILAEYSLKGSLDQGEDTFIFSLMGSTKAIKSSDSSLSAQCGGISIID